MIDVLQGVLLALLVAFEVGRRVFVWPLVMARLAQAEANATEAKSVAETMSDLIEGRAK